MLIANDFDPIYLLQQGHTKRAWQALVSLQRDCRLWPDKHAVCIYNPGRKDDGLRRSIVHGRILGFKLEVAGSIADYFALASPWKFAEDAWCCNTWLVVAPRPSANVAAEASAK